MTTLLDIAKQFFIEDEWPVKDIEGETILSTGFSGQNGQWRCRARTDEERFQLYFHSYFPKNAPYETRPAVMEFLTRANYGLLIGNFEMDIHDGEIRYKTSLDVEGDDLTPALVKQLVYANVLTMDRYFLGLEAVLDETQTPAQAIKMIERPTAALPSNLPTSPADDQIEA